MSEPPPRFVDPIQAVRTFEIAIESLVDGIERAGLKKGDRLPGEMELAEQLLISRPTLREAIVVLQRAGLLDARAGKGGGIFVASELIPTDAIWPTGVYDDSAAIDSLRARRLIEPAAVRLALVVATDSDFDAIEHTVNLARQFAADRTDGLRADGMFHRACIRASHNDAIIGAWRVIERGLAPLRHAYGGSADKSDQVLDIHQRQLEAMRNRDRAAVERVLDEHHRMLEEVFCSIIGSSWDSVFGPAFESQTVPPLPS